LTALPVLSHAQQQKSREEVNALYADRYNKLEEEHVAALSKVAATEEGEAANATYRLLFSLAIARNAYSAAEPAAEAVIKKDSYASDVEMLAHFINVIAEADQGKFAESLDDLKAYVQTHKDARKEVDPDTILAIGEAYFQRLIGAGKHDVAKQLCEFAATSPHEAVKAHFAKRASRLGLVGKPAPAVSGNNVDGKPLSLADFKGKVVLVDFWATWCPPCSMQMIRLNTLHEKYKDAGLEIVGVNVDGLRENADPKETKSLVRRYVIDHQARFPSILLEADDSTIPKAFGVEEIPANFLIDRKGNIIQFELNEGGLIKAIEDALKS
jgi:peroxiredoxin